jgi:transcriptional regulator with XRE-family HTH domain
MDTNHVAIDTDWSTPAHELGTLLKLSMAQQSISIRQLSKLSGISAATISRIITGKQPPSIHHLQEFSKHLGLSMKKLLHSMGVANMEQDSLGHSFLLEIIQDVVDDLKIDLDSVAADILKELDKLEQYARTKEGKKIILDSFSSKINAIDGTGAIIHKLNHFYTLFCSDDINEDKKAVIGSVLLYFTLTIDMIPDYCFPIGYLDDAIAVKIVEKKLSRMKD